MRTRVCKIEDASLLDIHDGGDGAYDLLDVCGSPQEVGKAIAESLAECDLYSRGEMTFEDKGRVLYLALW